MPPGCETELVAWLRGRGVRGVGQSSWGPTIFALARDPDQAARIGGRRRSAFCRRRAHRHRRRAGQPGALIECVK